MIKHFKLFSYFIHINNFIVFYDVDSFCIKNQNYENFKSNLFSLVLEKIPVLVFESWILFSPPITLIYILYIYIRICTNWLPHVCVQKSFSMNMDLLVKLNSKHNWFFCLHLVIIICLMWPFIKSKFEMTFVCLVPGVIDLSSVVQNRKLKM